MTDKQADKAQKAKATEEKAERLKQALRENLHRRKAQGRARKADPEEQT